MELHCLRLTSDTDFGMTISQATGQSPAPAKARYVMIGGFLGAGKTTAILRLADWFARQGRRVGLISNDQGAGLVDTAMFVSRKHAVQEIAGGCFCCRFNSLVEAARRLTAETRPEVFIAEPVGSCTDLVATVTYPLRQMYADHYTIAPLSVLVDPIRAARVLGVEPGAGFSEKVLYIYRKQLEEADLVVINKCDLLDERQIGALREALAAQFGHARLFEVSARAGEGLEDWFQILADAEQAPRAVMAVDYETYAVGEALLGWLNGTVQIEASSPFDANRLLRALAQEIQQRLTQVAAEVAHLKMTFDPHSAFGELAVVNLVRNDFVPELSMTLPEPVSAGELTINLRAEADPAALRSIAESGVQKTAASMGGGSVRWLSLESFKPGKPQPTHRVTSV